MIGYPKIIIRLTKIRKWKGRKKVDSNVSE